ncbi:MAG: hypothetical protein K0R38_247 [Polyangiaceae bacterium]|nr:hypothetical protein [Polyangiaceae bacterium]
MSVRLIALALVLAPSGCAAKDDAAANDTSVGRAGSAAGGQGAVTTEKELEATVDCISMMESGPKTAGYVQYAFTWAPLKGGGESHLGRYMEDDEPKRCTVAFRGDSVFEAGRNYKAFYGEERAHVFDADFARDTMMFAINYNGREYLSREGSFRVDFSETGKRAGTYDVYAMNDVGEVGHFTGRWDYCSYGIRRDCDYNVTGALERQARFTSPAVFDAEAEPSDCRVLVDEATGGVQVDVELAIWRGMSVTQLYTAGCDPGNRTGLNKNRFTFKTGGWKGPGKYGPFKSTKFVQAGGQELLLPSLYWQTPLSFQDVEYYSGNFQFCFFSKPIVDALDPFYARTNEGSVCEYEIRTEPGYVAISCSDVYHSHSALRTYVQPSAANGPFHMESDCDVEFK